MSEKKKPEPEVIELADDNLEKVQGGVDLAYGGDGHDVIFAPSPSSDAPSTSTSRKGLAKRDPSRS